jgi:integrase
MLRLAVTTGMRLSEIALLRWEDLDFRAGMLHVPEETKTGTRVLPMSKEAPAVLHEQRERRKAVGRESGELSPFVFVHDNGATYGTEYERRRISEVTRASARAAGLGAGVGFHTLRHTAASWMVSRGVSLYDVQKVLGHSTPTLTQRYAHLAPATLRRATDALDAVLSEKSDHSMTSQDAGSASSI